MILIKQNRRMPCRKTFLAKVQLRAYRGRELEGLVVNIVVQRTTYLGMSFQVDQQVFTILLKILRLNKLHTIHGTGISTCMTG